MNSNILYKEIISTFFECKREDIVSKFNDIQTNPLKYFKLTKNEIKSLHIELDSNEIFHLSFVIYPDLHPIKDKHKVSLYQTLKFDQQLPFKKLGLTLINKHIECKNCTYHTECKLEIQEHPTSYQYKNIQHCDCIAEWINENTVCEFNFLSDCWIEAKKMTNSLFKASICVHESTAYFDLDEKVFLEGSLYFNQLWNEQD